ncbi:hypothetical protein F4678DRAFT_69170 [Xylaria arbuscula]|nr:hypothetical protein F4678DRAFT_69170 [Xylaria arbuscula]
MIEFGNSDHKNKPVSTQWILPVCTTQLRVHRSSTMNTMVNMQFITNEDSCAVTRRATKAVKPPSFGRDKPSGIQIIRPLSNSCNLFLLMRRQQLLSYRFQYVILSRAYFYPDDQSLESSSSRALECTGAQIRCCTNCWKPITDSEVDPVFREFKISETLVCSTSHLVCYYSRRSIRSLLETSSGIDPTLTANSDSNQCL